MQPTVVRGAKGFAKGIVADAARCGYPAPYGKEKCERPAGHPTEGKDGWHEKGRAQWRTRTGRRG